MQRSPVPPRRDAGAPALRLASASFLALLAWSVATPAHAQVGLVFHAEGGGTAMVSSYQRDVLGLENGVNAALRPGLRIADVIGLELSFGGIWFPFGEGLGRVMLAGGGFRIEPMLGNVGRFVIDTHASYAYTGNLSRFAFDVGLAFEFQAGDYVGIGPYARYTHVFASGPNDGADAMMISYGLSFTVGPARPSAPDRDRDGFLDAADVCVDAPAGDSPDPGRAGCPLLDTDRDRVYDQDDVCPNDPAGRQSDPERAGCPLLDSDGDRVHDREDLCPNEPQGERPDSERAGCPLSDTDLDGVYDSSDACPTTPVGDHPDPTRRGCPDADDDADSVLNAVDQCPTEHELSTFHADPARPGCPLPDRDHDMVSDVSDACPDQPGAASSNARRNGCPGLVTVSYDHIAIEEQVFFATGADRILPRSRRVLQALAEALRLTPGIRRLSIEGHTDDIGEEAANRELSERRAASVMRWLVEHGIDASRLEAHGFGESAPIAEGTSRGARDENRRVGFRVIGSAPVTVLGGPS